MCISRCSIKVYAFLNTRSVNINRWAILEEINWNISTNLMNELLLFNIIQVHSPNVSFIFVFFSFFFREALCRYVAIYSGLFAEILADFIFVGHASANYSTYGGNLHDSHGSLHREIAWIAFCHGSAKLPLHLSILQIVPNY